MLQNTRNRFVATGFELPTALEAVVLAPWGDTTPDRLPHRPSSRPSTAAVSTWVPALDVEETEDAIRLAFEVPGVDPSALDVTLDAGVLTVSGERVSPRRERGQESGAYRFERRYGAFTRSVTLPKTVDPERIDARYEFGVLHLMLPKRPEAQPRRITIATREPSRADAAAPQEVEQNRIESGDANA